MPVKAYKGFNKDMTCNPNEVPFQYEEGKEYHTDEAELCQSGFHACENPLDCFSYYSPAESVYHEVELDEVTGERDNDTKICGKHIKIGARLDIAGIVKLAIDYNKKSTNPEHRTDRDCGASSATGYKGASSATGDYGASSATGTCGASSATGTCGASSATGYNCVALSAGYKGKAKASIGSAICICERGEWNGKTYPLLAIKAAIVDGKTLKPDTWYKLENGEFVEVEDET